MTIFNEKSNRAQRIASIVYILVILSLAFFAFKFGEKENFQNRTSTISQK